MAVADWASQLANRQFGGRFESPAEVLARTGWSRSVGGANPYLALRARGGFRREAVDAAIAAGEIAEVDAARGCTYVVPAEDLNLAATLASRFEAKATASDLKRLQYSIDDLVVVETAIIRALEGGELDAPGVKAAVGDANIHFGEIGKKVGRTDAVSLAVSSLVGRGRIRRISIDGRLDRQRYRYALAKAPVPIDEAPREFAPRYWGWIGSSTIRDFAGIAGLSLTEARAAIEVLPLEAEGDLLSVPPSHASSADDLVRLVGSLDNVGHLRWTAGPPVHALAADWKAPGEAKSLGYADQVPMHMILRGAMVIGLWHFDAVVGQIVARSVDDGSDVDRAIEEAEAWIAEELGDARTFSLDSMKSRAAAFTWLRDA